MTEPKSLRQTAMDYVNSGLSVIPCKKDKRPNVSTWTVYQKRKPTEEEIFWEFENAEFIGVVGGAVSENLGMIDFDLAGKVFDEWTDQVKAKDPLLYDKLVIESTLRDGNHVLARSDTVGKTRKLAYQFIPLDETSPNNDGKTAHYVYDNFPIITHKGEAGIKVCVVELRAEGAYCIAAPSSGYELTQGSMTEIPFITSEEWDLLIECAESFDDFPQEERPKVERTVEPGEVTPGNDFNNRGDIRELLEECGAQYVRTDTNLSTGTVYEMWTRPGKNAKEGVSAEIIDGKVFYVFTSNWAPFDQNRGYNFFAVYTWLKHDGDFSAAAKQLYKDGFGVKKQKPGEHVTMNDEDWLKHYDWPDPQKLKQVHQAIELNKEMCLPPILHEYVSDAVKCIGGAPEPLIGALYTSLGSVVGSQVLMAPYLHSGFRVCPNMYGYHIDRPGTRKSAMGKAAFKFMWKLEEDARIEFERVHASWELIENARLAQIRTWKSDLTALRNKKKKLIGNDGKCTNPEVNMMLVTQINVIEKDIAEPGEPEPTCRNYICEDVTPEALMLYLKENPTGQIVWSDELAYILAKCEKQNYEDLRGIYLKGWEGLLPHKIRRVERGEILIPRCTLSVYGTTQFSKIESMILDAVTGTANDDGFFQRFNMAFRTFHKPPTSPIEEISDKRTYKTVLKLYRRLASIVPHQVGAAAELDGDIPHKSFTPNGYKVYKRWYESHHKDIQTPDKYELGVVSHLEKYDDLVPALALINSLILNDEAEEGGVSATAVTYAINLANVLKDHALAIYGAVDGIAEDAVIKLGERITAGELPMSFNVEDIVGRRWPEFYGVTAKKMHDLLSVLVEHDWLIMEVIDTEGKRGPKPKIYHINPRLFAV